MDGQAILNIPTKYLASIGYAQNHCLPADTQLKKRNVWPEGRELMAASREHRL
jgi:hypothetical protein